MQVLGSLTSGGHSGNPLWMSLTTAASLGSVMAVRLKHPCGAGSGGQAAEASSGVGGRGDRRACSPAASRLPRVRLSDRLCDPKYRDCSLREAKAASPLLCSNAACSSRRPGKPSVGEHGKLPRTRWVSEARRLQASPAPPGAPETLPQPASGPASPAAKTIKECEPCCSVQQAAAGKQGKLNGTRQPGAAWQQLPPALASTSPSCAAPWLSGSCKTPAFLDSVHGWRVNQWGGIGTDQVGLASGVARRQPPMSQNDGIPMHEQRRSCLVQELGRSVILSNRNRPE